MNKLKIPQVHDGKITKKVIDATFVSDQIAWHQSGGLKRAKTYTVTHVPTGMAICKLVEDPLIANKIASLLAECPPPAAPLEELGGLIQKMGYPTFVYACERIANGKNFPEDEANVRAYIETHKKKTAEKRKPNDSLPPNPSERDSGEIAVPTDDTGEDLSPSDGGDNPAD